MVHVFPVKIMHVYLSTDIYRMSKAGVPLSVFLMASKTPALVDLNHACWCLSVLWTAIPESKVSQSPRLYACVGMDCNPRVQGVPESKFV